MKNYLSKLNTEQYKAATSIDGMNFILAGAGSGKTAVLVARVAYMLDNGLDPKNILLLTFTNKAAKEMKDRIASLVGENARFITACTFHSFCANFLRKNAKLFGFKENYTILDNPDMMDAIGISKTPEGSLTIDDHLLSQVAESEDAADLLAPLKNFSTSLYEKSETVSRDPLNYASKTIVAYKNPGKNFPSPYVTSNYSGLLFNYYC